MCLFYNLIFVRIGKQRLREVRIQIADFLILLLAGACLGTLAKVSDESFGALGYTYTVIAVCKLLTRESLTAILLCFFFFITFSCQKLTTILSIYVALIYLPSLGLLIGSL